MKETMQELTKEADVRSVLMVNTTQNRILFEKDADMRLPFASLTKMIPAILAVEKAGDPSRVVIEMEHRSLDEVRSLQPALTFTYDWVGRRVSLEDMLYGCMLESGCEAARQLAYYVGDGSMARFLEIAHAFLKGIGCTDTLLIDPTGLYDEGHFSTARDLMRVLDYAMRNPVFRRIVSTARYDLEGFHRPLVNTNPLISPESQNCFAYAVGGKTGWTDIAGVCLACRFERGGQEYAWISLGYPSDGSAKIRNRFYRDYVVPMVCRAFMQEGDFMRVVLPEHIRRALPGDRFALEPIIAERNCAVEPMFRFESSDETVVSVDPSGVVTVHGRGAAQIKATAATGDCDLCIVDARETERGTLRRIL